MKQKIYMAVTPDEYELPMAVCDTVAELARLFGVSKDIVFSAISHGHSGTQRGAKFVRVEVPS